MALWRHSPSSYNHKDLRKICMQCCSLQRCWHPEIAHANPSVYQQEAGPGAVAAATALSCVKVGPAWMARRLPHGQEVFLSEKGGDSEQCW